MNAKYLTHMIEDAPKEGLREEYATFITAIESLSNVQLRELSENLDIRFTKKTSFDRDALINIMDETTWEKFFTAYHKVVGQPFLLDG